jgi:hypothetical protein
MFTRIGDLPGAKTFVARQLAFMPVEPGTPTPVPMNPAERALVELWPPTAAGMSPAGRRQFRQANQAMLESWLWEFQNQRENRIPDPVDYVEMRRDTFGSGLTMSLARLRQGERIPPEIFRTRPLRSLENAAADYACFTNDVFSYQKEIEFEGEVNNMVLVVQQFLDVDKDRAVGVVNDLMSARMRQFQHVTDVEFPALFDDYGLDDDARQALKDFAEELEDWMSGIQAWHRAIDRYKEPELRRLPSPGWVRGTPTGLGSAAATLASLLRTGLAAVGAGGPGNAADPGAPLTGQGPDPGEVDPGRVPALVGADAAPAVAEGRIPDAAPAVPDPRVPGGPRGLGTSATHVAPAMLATDPPAPVSAPVPQEPSPQSPASRSRILEGATGLGTAAARLSSLRPDRSA